MANAIPSPQELSIQSLTQLDADTQKSLPHYFAQLELEEKLKIEDRKKETIRMFSGKRTSIEANLFFYACWLYAISEFRSKKKRKLSSAERDEVEALRIQQMGNITAKRKAPNRKFIVDHLPLLDKLIKEGKGWRQISKYLKTYHKKSISFNYLRTVYIEVQQ